MDRIYFDNSATTELCSMAKEKMEQAIECYGNPSSLHTAGLEAEKLVREARMVVCRSLGIRNPKDGELIFTSGGSEADNLAIFGTVFAKSRRTSNKILTTAGEHSAVENALRRLEEQGFEVVRISTEGGVLDAEQIKAEAKGVLLATFMMVNNETGAIYDISSAFKTIKSASPEAVCHTDAVQGYMKRKFSVATLGADLVTVSAHKIHGPKGIGALWISPAILKAKKIVPWLLGGGQEFGIRSGTENTIGIAGFGGAATQCFETLDRDIESMMSLRDYIADRLPDEVEINLPQGERAPHILSLRLPSIKSETMLHFLSSKGICVSSGSACSSHSRAVSSALSAFGLDNNGADSTIRVSLNARNTQQEADAFLAALSEGVSNLVRIRK